MCLSSIKQQEVISVDSCVLFRFSALTFNNHKIHYDPFYAKAVEGYPGLVVHGPLLCTLLLDFYQRSRLENGLDPYSGYEFAYKSIRPLFVDSKVHLAIGDDGALYVANDDGHVCMTARVQDI